MTTHRANTTRGAIWLISALFLFAVQDAIVKQLTATYPVLQILTLRTTLVTVMIVGIGLYLVGPAALQGRGAARMMFRGVLAFTAFFIYYVALGAVPLGDAATVFQTAPLFVTVLSIPLLGERVGLFRSLAVIIGFSAVIIMLNPGSNVFQPMVALPLISALIYALIPILTRSIDATVSPLTITLYSMIGYVVLCAVITLLAFSYPPILDPNNAHSLRSHPIWREVAMPWAEIDLQGALLMLVIAALFSGGLYGITAAYRAAEVSAIASFEYSYVVWAMVIGFLAFGDVPTLKTLAAAVVVAGCGVAVAIRESRQLAHNAGDGEDVVV